MSQFERKQNQEQEEKQKEHIKFLGDCFSKLIRWQLDNNCILIPFVSGPWMRGVFQIGADITFREANEEDRKMLEEQIAKNAGIVLPEGNGKI